MYHILYVCIAYTINSFFFRFRCPSSSVFRLPRCNCHWIRPLHAFLKLGSARLGPGSVQSSSSHALCPFPQSPSCGSFWNSVFVQFQLEIHDSRFACIYFDCIRWRAGCIMVGAAATADAATTSGHLLSPVSVSVSVSVSVAEAIKWASIMLYTHRNASTAQCTLAESRQNLLCNQLIIWLL